MVLGHYKQGDSFGALAALNDIPSPVFVVACSPKVEFYKIHRSNFSPHFGGKDGEHIGAMRGWII